MSGRLLVNTGNGKGKTTAAIGQAVRAVGAGWQVLMLQFIKGKGQASELEALAHLPNFELRQLGLGCTIADRKLGQLAEHQAAVAAAWAETVAAVRSDTYDLIILDELNYVLSDPELNSVANVEALLALLAERPTRLHLVITGRRAPEKLTAIADTVTEFQPVKHAYQAGIKGQKGIEF